jgi:hypothetical protein
MRHKIISYGPDGLKVLFETNNLTDAENWLCYYLNHGHDAYLESHL